MIWRSANPLGQASVTMGWSAVRSGVRSPEAGLDPTSCSVDRIHTCASAMGRACHRPCQAEIWECRGGSLRRIRGSASKVAKWDRNVHSVEEDEAVMLSNGSRIVRRLAALSFNLDMRPMQGETCQATRRFEC
jgi:hypothetical protein